MMMRKPPERGPESPMDSPPVAAKQGPVEEPKPAPKDPEAERLEKAARDVEQLLSRARAADGADPHFARRSEVRSILDEARQQAPPGSRVADAEAAYRRDYDARFAVAAAEAWKNVVAAADAQPDAAGARRALEAFPSQFVDGDWSKLYDERLRLYSERAAKEAEANRPVPPTWKEYQQCMQLVREGRIDQAGPRLESVLEKCADREALRKEGVNETQIREMGREGQFAMARYFARQQDAQIACGLIESAIRNGLTDLGRIDTEADFAPIRDTGEFRTLSRQLLVRRRLAITGRPITAERAQAFGLPEGKGGVETVAVVSGTPVEKAGLRRGDVILQVDDKWLPLDDPVQSLGDALFVVKPETLFAVVAWRDGKRVTFTVRWPKP
jgi:PDZ domain